MNIPLHWHKVLVFTLGFGTTEIVVVKRIQSYPAATAALIITILQWDNFWKSKENIHNLG